MAEIKLGINNCFAVKRWPESEEWCRIIREEFDLTYVQFTFDLIDPFLNKPARPKISQDIARAAKKYGLTLTTTFAGLSFYSFNQLLHPDVRVREQALSFCEEAVVMTGELGVKATGGPLGSLSLKDFNSSQRKEYLTDHLIESLQYLADLASSLGQEYLLWEPTPLSRELTETIEKAHRFYERVNKGAKIPILFCLDVGHQCKKGTSDKDRDPYTWLKEFASASPVVHIQQTDGMLDRHWPFTSEYNRRGIIEPQKVVQAINKSAASEVVLILEVLHAFEEDEDKVLSDIKDSINYWKQVMSQG